jgi:hypothetical protein
MVPMRENGRHLTRKRLRAAVSNCSDNRSENVAAGKES